MENDFQVDEGIAVRVYEWQDKPESATARRRGVIALAVQRSSGQSDGTYGYRRVHAGISEPAYRRS
jgi:hypothetical protein